MTAILGSASSAEHKTAGVLYVLALTMGSKVHTNHTLPNAGLWEGLFVPFGQIQSYKTSTLILFKMREISRRKTIMAQPL